MNKSIILPGILLWLLTIYGCVPSNTQISGASMSIISSAFKNEGTIPQKFTCDGDDISPALAWSGTPEGTQSLMLIMDDPDAFPGTFTHWIVYNLPPSSTGLPENIPAGSLSGGGIQGRNSIQQNKYMGPCPPVGGAHRYFFSIFATDIEPALPEGLSVDDLSKRMAGHILARGEWMGTYQK